MSHKRLKVDVTSNLVKSTSMNDLPVEVLTQIFSFYIESEGNGKLCSVLGQVSPTWHEITLKWSFWKEVTFTADDFGPGYAWLKDPLVLERLSSAKTLNFKCGRFVVYSLPQVLELILNNSPNLENFTFEFNRGLKVPSFMFDLSTLCPKITCIQSKNINCSTRENVFFSWIESYNVNLTRLTICQFFGEGGSLTLLSQKLAKFCPNMTYLELDMIPCNAILDLSVLQAGCLKMKELILKNLSFADNDDQKSCFLQLEKFSFRPFPVTFYSSKVQQSVIRALRGAKKLKELELIDVNPSADTMLRLPCESLKKLRFQYYSVHARGLYVALCQWRHSLIELDVSCSDNSLKFLFQYVERFGKADLESLTVQSFSIKIERLKQIVQQCQKLQFLNFKEIPNSSKQNVFSSRKRIKQWLEH